jgi:hypothetical protein
MSSTTAQTSEARARERLYAAPTREFVVPALTVFCAVALGSAWVVREELYLSPEHGLGYALGIVGLSMMGLLLLYSPRKRLRSLGSLGPLRHWFRAHMALGVLGPVAILLHSNLHLGSFNSTVALISMLLVAGSGFVGRFFYARIHRGLFGRRRHLSDLQQETSSRWIPISDGIEAMPKLAERLAAFEAWSLAPALGPLRGTNRLLSVGWRARSLHRRALRELRHAGIPDLWHLDADIQEYLWSVCRVVRFRAYERFFSVWHALHVPLCVLLFGAATAHVLAVHLY